MSADAGAQVNSRTLPIDQLLVGVDRREQAFAEHIENVGIGWLNHDQEFVAAPARSDVVGTDDGQDDFGNDFQRLIANGMTMPIIQGFEVVDVNPENSHLEQFSFSTDQLRFDPFGHAAAVEQLGQRIDLGQPLERHCAFLYLRFQIMPGFQNGLRHAGEVIDQIADFPFARQQLDGVIYQTLPSPANPYEDLRSFASTYRSGEVLNGIGRVRVTVAPEKVRVDYVRTAPVGDPAKPPVDGEIAFAYEIAPNSR